MQIKVIRVPGDKIADEPIVDELCTQEHVARERGRNFLDQEGFDKDIYEISAPYRGVPLPGSVAVVHNACLGESFWAKVRACRIAITVNGEVSDVTATYEIERSLT